MRGARIQSVDAGSPAAQAGLRAGETLLAINGNPIADVLDYQFYAYDPRLAVTVTGADGTEREVRIRKGEGEPLGLSFETYLMDTARSCANQCVFCFVDQLPPGMRETLYFKDDDARLSFLMGNYITLTNLSEREANRIIDLHISPINISVHATDPAVRSMLLGHPKGGRGLELMARFAAAGITMNCQIVACPGLNDGEQLQKSVEDLAAMHPAVHSVSVVPVGLTRYREGLPHLTPYDAASAGAVIDRVEGFAARCAARLGSRIFWCADEFYLKANRPLPADSYYEDYAQLENGVGMLRLLRTEFEEALEDMPPPSAHASCKGFSLATGVAAAPFIRELVALAAARRGLVPGAVYAIENRFFGGQIDVAGLITGGDLIDQLRGRELGARLLIPATMLRHGEGVFLDDVTVTDVERELSVRVIPVGQDGGALCRSLFGEEE